MDSNVHTVYHVESLRRRASYYWPDLHDHTCAMDGVKFCNNQFRPALNLHTLISSLSCKEEASRDKEDAFPTNVLSLGKRKRVESRADSCRRVRLDDDVARKESNDNFDGNGKTQKQIYPSSWISSCDVIKDADQSVHTSFLQVYQFAVHLRYDKAVHQCSPHYADEKAAANLGWSEEEDILCSLLQERQRDASLSQVVDMGRIFLTRYHGRLLALSGQSLGSSSQEMIIEQSQKWLFLLPNIPWPDGLAEDSPDEQHMRPVDVHRDFTTACSILQSNRRTKLEANVQLHILSKDTYDPIRDLPFELRAHFTLSLAIPETYCPFKISFSQGWLNELEDLQRRLVCFLSGAPLTRPVQVNTMEEAVDVTIPFFLKIMRPAPPLAQDVNYESLQPDGLLVTLLPFQRRTVAWMLEREGKRITPVGTVAPLDNLGGRLPLFWEEIEIGAQKFFFNRLTGALSPTLPDPHPALGGILAEEPGLGKTMECLSLILLNPAPERNPSNQRWDPKVELDVREIKTTLIVTPPALATQWVDELAAYAPDLKVFVYHGWTKLKVLVTGAEIEAEREKRNPMEAGEPKRKHQVSGLQDDNNIMSGAANDSDVILNWPNFINKFDVCITTYNVLRSDLTVARAAPKRPRRQCTEYNTRKRQRSPMVMCEWYRVIMDEVQMMGVGASEEMVTLIPRLSSFAVSGTPARAQVSDLISVLRFLRIDDLVAPMRMWKRLLKHEFKDLFVSLFQRYSVRTLKTSVKNELVIPEQQRYLVGIELGRVERHVYDQALEESLVELGLDARGVAAYEGWQADAGILRNVLRRLRGICTHPQVGQLPKQGDKRIRTDTLKSIADVLESMKDHNWKTLMEDRRAKILVLTRLAQLQQHCSDDRDRYQRALEHLLAAEIEANQLIDDIKATIAQHNLKGEILKKEAKVLKSTKILNLVSSRRLKIQKSLDKGKGREVECDSLSSTDDADSNSDGDDDDVENRGLPKTPAGEDHRAQRIALLTRLRECLIALHRVKFLQGDVYHVLGSTYSGKEDVAYAKAENLRKHLLKSTEEVANRAMRRLSASATEKRVTERALQISLPFLEGGGTRSTHLFEEANEIIEDVLNKQSALLWKWRTKIVELLTQTLSLTGEQTDGEEYARTLDTQGAAEAHLQAYATLLADRRETIAAERTLLAALEGREKKMRKTKAAARAEFDMQEDEFEIPDDISVQPQDEVVFRHLSEQRKGLLQPSGRALKSVMVDLTAVAARLPREKDAEKVIAKDGATKLRELIADLQNLTDKLDADLAVIRKVFNDRILYFRQLQEISDTVAEVHWEGFLADAMEAASLDNINLGVKINTSRARQRYLEHLTEGDSDMDNENSICVLCQCEFSEGFITQCVHMCCGGCMEAWIRRSKGGACPVCRTPIKPSQLQRFMVQEDQPPQQSIEEPVPVSRRIISYNMIDSALFADIQTAEARGNYGSKIQTLVRHLLHIQLVDPGAKSIIFSAWADSLTIIEHALLLNGIPCIRLDHNQGRGKSNGAKKFRIDPTLQVLLLHGERDNAGLNITCASRVFLLESVVNHNFEVQAIARIDRMGQTRATEVFCYYAKDTVEKNILDLAARQGLSLYTKDNSAGSLNVTSFTMDSEKKLVESPRKLSKQKQKGDFIFKVNDMLAILFPHMFEDIEFLLPPGARNAKEAQPCVNGQANHPVRPPVRRLHVNAEAGPSRLPMS